MKSRNLPIAIIYCVFCVLSIPLLIALIYYNFLFGTIYHRVSFLILGISVFLYALFNTLSHWITKDQLTLNSLKKISLITSSLVISSILLVYSFCTLDMAAKWIMFGLICLFFAINQLLFFIWTKIPFFLAEIFKDINYIIYLIFLPCFLHYFLINDMFLSFIILTITSVILLIISIIFKYIFSGTNKVWLYTVSRILSLCSLIIQIIIFLLMIIP